MRGGGCEMEHRAHQRGEELESRLGRREHRREKNERNGEKSYRCGVQGGKDH